MSGRMKSFVVWIILVARAVLGNATKNVPLGGTIKFDYMHNSTSGTHSFLLNRDNSTMFTESAPLPPADGIWGELIPFSPLDACGPLELSNYTRQIGSKIQFVTVGPYPHVVALVKRGNCSFEEKFDWVDNVPNVIGMLVYDYEDGGNLSNDIEVSTFRLTSIPGFLITNQMGVRLKQEVDEMRKRDRQTPTDPLWVKVTLRYVPFGGPFESIIQYVLLLVMVALCVAFLVSVYMHYHLYRLQQRLGEHRHAEARNAITIDQTFLEKIPIRKYRKCEQYEVSDDEKQKMDGAGVSSPHGPMAAVEEDDHILHAHAPPNETCPICLDEFNFDEILNELPCGHFYHISCIRPWLQCRSPLCPLCKEDVRDAFVILPPLEEEEPSILSKMWKMTLNFAAKTFCCKRSESDHAPPARSQMEEVRVVTPNSSRDEHAGSLHHIPLDSSTAN